jgi:hypothetical protein
LKKNSLLCLFSLLLAAIIRWPCIPFVHTAPLDPNFALHALSASTINGFQFSTLKILAYPDGISAQFIAIPVLIISKILALLFSPIAATNIAVWLWVAIQGIGTALLFKEKPLFILLLIASAAMLNPLGIVALGNGQWENIAIWPIVLAIHSTQLRNWKILLLALLLCSSCSPYILITALLCITPYAIASLKKPVLYATIGIPLLLSWAYYQGAETNQSAHMGPAPAQLEEPAQLGSILFPINQAEDGGVLLPSAKDRLVSSLSLPSKKTYGTNWPWKQATASSYIGLPLIFLAGLGWFQKRDRRIIYGIGLCLILSLGTSFAIGTLKIPLPWALLSITPLAKMAATYRILTGVGAFLILCISELNWSRTKNGLAVMALVCDGLLLSPAHWPLGSLEAVPSESLEPHLHEKAVAFWPAAPSIAPHKIVMTALMLNRPLALFEDKQSQMPLSDGTIPHIQHKQNVHGEAPDEWRNRLLLHEVQTLIQFKNMIGEGAHPFYEQVERCDDYFCVISLSKEE